MAAGNQALVDMARRRARRTITNGYGEAMVKDVAGLTELLDSEDGKLRFAAVTCLGVLGAGAKAAIEPLVRLQDTEPQTDTRVMIKWALRRINVA